MKRHLTCLALLGVLCGGHGYAQTPHLEAWLRAGTLPADVSLLPDLGHLLRSVRIEQPLDPDQFRPTGERSRGAGAEVYPKIAPAVVLVRSPFGHGTGFFIRGDGWLLTNHHVVEDGRYCGLHGCQIVDIHMGILGDDGWMERVGNALTGLVYRTDPRRDLALVKLSALPPGHKQVPFVRRAAKAPGPSEDCVAIGHPAKGTLWTVRSGEVSGSGIFPDDHMDIVMAMLGLRGQQRLEVEDGLKKAPHRKRVLLSTCGLNPGDSGGPLVNETGELIGVSFALPVNDPGQRVQLDKFSYHIHVSEVEEFLSQWPREPQVDPPNTLPQGSFMKWLDVDGDGYFDTLLFGRKPGGETIGLALDLNGDSFAKRSIAQMRRAGIEPSFDDWNYEFAVTLFPRKRFAYDTDNDGILDLVLSDENLDGQLDTKLRLVDGLWQVLQEDQLETGASLFEDERLGKRYEQLMRRFAGN